MRVGATIFCQNHADWDRYEAEEQGVSVPEQPETDRRSRSWSGAAGVRRSRRRSELRPKTVELYAMLLRKHLLPAFGDYPLAGPWSSLPPSPVCVGANAWAWPGDTSTSTERRRCSRSNDRTSGPTTMAAEWDRRRPTPGTDGSLSLVSSSTSWSITWSSSSQTRPTHCCSRQRPEPRRRRRCGGLDGLRLAPLPALTARSTTCVTSPAPSTPKLVPPSRKRCAGSATPVLSPPSAISTPSTSGTPRSPTQWAP